MKIGPITLTRDSVWWGVSAALSFAAVLATFTDTSGPLSLAYYGIPASWLPYIRLLALVNTWFSGKMSNSPAPSSGEVARGIRDNGRPIVLLLLAVALGASSCASLGGARHRAAVSVVSAKAVLGAIQDVEMTLVCGRATAPPAPSCVPIEKHREISAHLVTAFGYNEKALKIARALPGGETSPDVFTLIGQVRALVDAVLALIPESPQRRALVANIGGH